MRKIKKIYKRFLARLDKNDFNYKEAMEVYKKANALLIDVRTPEEYRKEHIDGAINLPEYNIRRNIQNILPDKNQLIILYCSVGERSKMAQNKLKRLGYTNVYTVYEGIGDALFFPIK